MEDDDDTEMTDALPVSAAAAAVRMFIFRDPDTGETAQVEDWIAIHQSSLARVMHEDFPDTDNTGEAIEIPLPRGLGATNVPRLIVEFLNYHKPPRSADELAAAAALHASRKTAREAVHIKAGRRIGSVTTTPSPDLFSPPIYIGQTGAGGNVLDRRYLALQTADLFALLIGSDFIGLDSLTSLISRTIASLLRGKTTSAMRTWMGMSVDVPILLPSSLDVVSDGGVT